MKKEWQCSICKNKYHIGFKGEINRLCPSCGGRIYLMGAASWKDFDDKIRGIGRYQKIIPVLQENMAKIIDEKFPEISNLVKSEKLAKLLRVKSLFLLPTIEGPSGTFKDLEAAVVIAKCLDWNINKNLSWHSTGNTARAYREYSIKAGFSSTSFFPLSCLSKWRGARFNIKNKLFAYDGPFQDISKIAKERAVKFDCFHLAPLDWKLEGKAIMAYVIAEQSPNTTLIVQTIAGGYGPLGIDLGFERLRTFGLIKTDTPNFGLYQLSGADTISRLMPENREIEKTDLCLPLNSLEPTLQSTNPLSTFNLLRKVINNKHSYISSVTSRDTVLNFPIFEKECNDLGINISFHDEKSPFISWAGLVNDSNRGILKRTDEIVLIITGAKQRTGTILCPDYII